MMGLILCHSYLEWSIPIRLLPAEVELSSNGQPDKEPIAETEVVNKQKDIFYGQVDEGHSTLLEKIRERAWKIPSTMFSEFYTAAALRLTYSFGSQVTLEVKHNSCRWSSTYNHNGCKRYYDCRENKLWQFSGIKPCHVKVFYSVKWVWGTELLFLLMTL